ncbi:porin [Paraburkholderia sediminicola]|uniref:porin n=1 Tax=Paraburkholderia sediminicola TaxID=458836 RepID=UPI0038B90F41
MMRRKLLVKTLVLLLASAGCCSAAHAQSVTLYGTVDTGVEYVTHANATGGSVFRMPSYTGEFPSRVGLQGNEPLGGGYKAVFTLEEGFSVGNGVLSQGGRLFGRQAFVGVSGAPGTLTFGRQYNILLWTLIDSDLVGPSMYGLTSLDPYIANARSDNAVVYRGSFGNFSVGASYSFGRDNSPTGGTNAPGEGTCAGSIPGNAQACREWSAMVKYGTPAWGASFVYDQQNGGPGAAANLFNGDIPVPLTSSSDHDNRFILDGYAKFGNLKLAALWVGRHVDFASGQGAGVTSNQYVFEAAYQVAPDFVVDGLVQRIINSQQDTRATMEVLRATYLLSVRSSVYVQCGWLQNSAKAAYVVTSGGPATPGKGMGQFGTMVGIRHDF